MPIRVLLVDDSPVVLTILKRMLNSETGIEVVGIARTGIEALALIPRVQPQVICTDLQMPGMDGIEFIQEVMTNFPRPILVLSASVQPEETQKVFRLLQIGAVDVLSKPISGVSADLVKLEQELIAKIRVISGISVFTLSPRRLQLRVTNYPSNTEGKKIHPLRSSRFKIVGIGASTGGPQALKTILAQLPIDVSVPIVCVQHISPGFLIGLVKWLSSECCLPIQIAKTGEVPQPGKVYFPPENRHLELDDLGRFICSHALPVLGHRPSVTVTFKSMARCYGRQSMGILLTGMGQDGAAGMQEISRSGGLTIAQDEATSVVFGMPKEAIALGAAQQVLPLESIAAWLEDGCKAID